MASKGKAVVSVLAAGLALWCGPTAAVLPTDQASGLEAVGRVDLDGFGPQAPQAQTTDVELAPPAFSRSIVGVAGSNGDFAYSASSDIGRLALRLSGSLKNPTASAYFGNGVPVLFVSAEAKDVITLESTLPGSFEVGLELVVNGSIATTGDAPRLQPFANAQLRLGELNGGSDSDSARYEVGSISDTLRVTRTVSGPTVDLTVGAFLSFGIYDVAPGASAAGDLSNTAFIKLVLPEQGVTLAGSDSGTFGVSIPVPEPATHALWLAGLAALVGGTRWARRRRG